MSAQPTAERGATLVAVGAHARIEQVELGYRCRWEEAHVDPAELRRSAAA